MERIQYTMPEIPVTGNSSDSVVTARLYYLDNIRVLLISLIVLLHLAITYGAPGGWYVFEVSFDTLGPVQKIIYSAYNATVQGFALGFFFLLSGYFTAASLERKGTRRFVKDRMIRLGIPLIVYTAVINPVLIYLLYARQERFFPFLLSHFVNLDFSVGPMWFVAALLLFTMVYILRQSLKGAAAQEQSVPPAMPRISRLFVIGIVTGLIAFAIRFVYPAGWSLPLLNFQFGYFTQYIVMFALGTMAWRLKWFDRVTEYRPAVWFAGAAFLILIMPAPLIFGSGELSAILGGMTWQAFSYALWESLICICMVIGLSAFFRRHFNGKGSWLGALPPNAYAVYVIHPPVMIALTIAFTELQLSPLLKFMVMSPIVLTGCFVTAALLRAIPGVKKVL